MGFGADGSLLSSTHAQRQLVGWLWRGGAAHPHRRRRPRPARPARRPAARRRLRDHDRPRRRRGLAPSRDRLAGPPDHRHDDAAHATACPSRARSRPSRTCRSSSSRRSTPPTRRRTCSTRSPRTTSPSRTTTRSCAPGSTGSCGASGTRSRGASLIMGPDLTLELHRREATVARDRGQADADRVAAALRAGREPRQDGLDRHAPRPRLGRDRGRRPVVRLGDDAPAAPEARGRPQPAGPPADGPGRRLPARGAPRRRGPATRSRAAVVDDGARRRR